MAGFDAGARRFVRGEGNYLFDERGNRLLDAVSSIWTTLHGHCHPYIIECISKQAAKLDHSTLLGATNPAAEELAARLCLLANMHAAFFSGDGASAVEAALKMALQFWQNQGQSHRNRFVHLRDSYHGDTAGAMSVSDIELFKGRFTGLTFSSATYDGFAELRLDDVAAVIVEPIVQAAAGMRIVPSETYAKLPDMDALLIVDEIATGFGRTGTMFAHEQLGGLKPDLLVLGKGLSGGTVALSATLATSSVYESFLGDFSKQKHLFHGHSYAGNPIACAAALASLDIFERNDVLGHVATMSRETRDSSQRLAIRDDVTDVRGAGLMYAVQVDAARIAEGAGPPAAWRIAERLYERGFFTRPIGEAIQFVPPLSIEVKEIGAFFDALEQVLDELS
ncbi:MAG: adenosylmethionine--8-amino-7-oxononanoate transaminase [Candidatus Meridianibacter frigidus]|nr:MAG: adenosylmethionine--8-amino-7-oxononanoate transaminase [Candidatus Eremiobacteraeota bacterium]